MAWLRIDADFPADGAVRSTGYAWAWAVILAAFKRSKIFGRLSDIDLCDRALFDVAQVPGCPAGRSWTVRDAYVDAGLLTRTDDGWAIPSWEKYQEDPSKSERQAAYREANAERRAEAEKQRRESKRVATRGDGVATRGDAERRVATPDVDVDLDRTEQQQPPVAIATVPPSPPELVGEVEPQAETAPLAAPKLTARQRQAVDLHAKWVATIGATGARASAATAAGKKRVATIAARLADGFSAEDVERVIVAGCESEWHRAKGLTAPEFTCRADQFDRLLTASNARASPPAVASVNDGWSSRIAAATAQAKADEDKHAALDELPF